MGRLRQAERLYAAGHDIAASAGDAQGAAQAAIGAGNVLEEQGRWAASERWYLAALSLLEPVAQAVPEEWHALLNLHVVKRSRGEVDESELLLERAERVAAALGDDAARPFVRNARGQLHMARGDHAEAERLLRDALLATRDSRSAVQIRLNLAEALMAQGRLLDAAEEAREAERTALASGMAGKLPEVYRLLGRVAAERGLTDAFVFFEHALELIRARELPALEEALTLLAYADARARIDDDEEVEAMRARARDLLRDLGIEGTRATWADVFATGPATEPGARSP
jgi:tetratricopeptide (TPR) repeat protein